MFAVPQSAVRAEKRVSMACSKSKILFLRHSFIRRLEDDINSAHKPWLSHNFCCFDAQCVQSGPGFFKFKTWREAEKNVSMACSKSKILFLGHSFIRRLEDDINSAHKPWQWEPLPVPFDAAIIQLGGYDLCLTYCGPLGLRRLSAVAAKERIIQGSLCL